MLKSVTSPRVAIELPRVDGHQARRNRGSPAQLLALKMPDLACRSRTRPRRQLVLSLIGRHG